MRKRTQAREIALQALYQLDQHKKLEVEAQRSEKGPLKAPSTVDDFEPFIQDQAPDPGVRAYARFLIDGVISRQPDLDGRITAVTANWKLHRIAPVDRSILRLGLFEILESPDVPPKVAINEAIELAKKYSTEQSGAFVNGILDQVYEATKKS